MSTKLGNFHYLRDTAGRLKSITNPKGELFTMSYDLNQRLKELTTPVTVTKFSFDSSGFNTQIQHGRKSGAIIDKVIYGRDDIGNRISKTTNAGTTSFEYDKNYQLTKSISPSLPVENFSYDSLSNRTSDSNSTYVFDESKQLIEEDYKYQYVFDLNGNMTSKIEKGFTGNVENFDYTSENQLKTFRLYESGILTKEVQYLYDSIGRRIEKTVVNHKDNLKSYTKRFAYDGEEILFEMDGENTITKTYTHSTLRTDDVLSVATENNSYFFLKDGLGTITDIADSNGFKVQHYDYSAFGKLLKIENGSGEDIASAPVIEPYFTYTGREYDEETGLYYYRARYYEPALGRFLTVDPDAGRLSNPITHINKYSYVGNNPINRIDPSGSFSINVGDVFGYAFGGVTYGAFRDKIRDWATDHREELIQVAIIGGAVAIGAGAPVLIGATIGAGFGYANGGDFNSAFNGALKGGAIAGISAVTFGVFAGAGVGIGAFLGGPSGAIIGGAIGGAAGGAAGSYVSQRVVEGTSHKDISWDGVILGGALGGSAGAYAGFYNNSNPLGLNIINWGTDGATDAASRVPEYRQHRSAD